MNWKKIKNDITKEKPSSFYTVSNGEYMEKWLKCIDREWITKNSKITSYGYAVYVSMCLCLDKKSLYGGPLIKTKYPTYCMDLETTGLITMNQFKFEYEIGNEAPATLTVLVRCMRGYGAPRI